MNVELKDAELALTCDAIIGDIKRRLNDLARSNIEYHIDLDEVASRLRMVHQMIMIEDKLWKAREHLASNESEI